MYGIKGEKHPMFGKHHSVETKEKISKANKGKFAGEKNPMFGKHHTEEAINKIKKPIEQIDIETGKVLRTWKSATDVHNELGWSIGNISNCCRGIKKYAYGYIWKFAST